MSFPDLRIGLYKIFFHLFLCVQESTIPLLPPPIRITRTIAILLRDVCAIYDLPPTSLLYAIHHTRLVITMSCKGQADPRGPCAPLAHLGLYKVMFYFEAVVHESTFLLSPPPTCIAHTVAILLRYYCAIFDPPPDPLFVCHTPYHIVHRNIV